MIRVGTLLYGYCGGHFGRDYYLGPRRVEALGADWVVTRNEQGRVEMAEVAPEALEPYTTPEVTT